MKETDVQHGPKKVVHLFIEAIIWKWSKLEEPKFTQPSILYFNKVFLNTHDVPTPFQVLGTAVNDRKDPDLMIFTFQQSQTN